MPSESTVPTAMPDAPISMDHPRRLQVLDGWRATSILVVLACHMLPLGPKRWHVNGSAGLAGMALFFTLSGFLIASTIDRNPSVPAFLIRRLARIVPLAYLATLVYFMVQLADWRSLPAHLFFYLNYDDARITPETAHFWSLCVEVHFYAVAALATILLGRRGLLLLPLFGLAITAMRLQAGAVDDIKTHLRADEILAGATLALAWLDKLGGVGRVLARLLRAVPTLAWLALFVAVCSEFSGPLRYLRPYAASALIGGTLFRQNLTDTPFTSRPMRYVAEISYALYVIHPLSMSGWLGSGEGVVKYAKRPLSIAITFGLAHLSTFHYERPWIDWGKRRARRFDARPSQGAPTRDV